MRELFLFLLLSTGAAAAQEPIESRARWACSGHIVRHLTVPGSVQWTRRSQWPVVEVRGVWIVRARLTSSNRMGVTVPAVMECAMRYSPAANAWPLVEIRRVRE